MLKATLLAIVLLDCTAVGRFLFGVNALRASANTLRTEAVVRFAGKLHVEFPGEVVPC